ncbi:MAG: ribose-phosphate pyrophosphokinase [Firmicutes bacterium]|nr:ribose-phosphate pyrophosphokinase [Bacillota bacterium]
MLKNAAILAGNSNLPLAKQIAKNLGMQLYECRVSKFSDGEISVKINQSVRGMCCYIIQSTSSPVNDNLMELLIMIDALKRASAKRIVAVMPYYGYARQDRKNVPREPITAKLVANLLTAAGASRVLSIDLHASQIQGFFDIPLDHIYARTILIEGIKALKIPSGQAILIAPDVSSVGRARSFARLLDDAPIAIIDKRRPEANKSEVMHIIGDVKGKVCIMVDDMIDTAGTICTAADALIKEGAKEVYAAITHPVLSGPAIERLGASSLKKLITVDTIEMPKEKRIAKIQVLSCAKLLAETIANIHADKSISAWSHY